MLLATNYWKVLSHIQNSWCCQPDAGTQARQKHELALSLRSVEVQGTFNLIGLSLKTKKDWNVDPPSLKDNRPQYISYGLKLHYRILAYTITSFLWIWHRRVNRPLLIGVAGA